MAMEGIGLSEIKAARKALDAKRARDAPDGIQLSRRAKAARRAWQSKRKDKKLMSAQSARAQRSEVLGRDGAWKQAAQEMARLCQQPGLDYLPSAYAALSLPACLSMTSELYESLEQTEWRTCVVCWRAWYDPPQEYGFQKVQFGRRSTPVPWFNLAELSLIHI